MFTVLSMTCPVVPTRQCQCCILNLGTTSRWPASYPGTSPHGTAPDTSQARGWVGPTDAKGPAKRKIYFGRFEPGFLGHPACSLVAIPTNPSLLSIMSRVCVTIDGVGLVIGFIDHSRTVTTGNINSSLSSLDMS